MSIYRCSYCDCYKDADISGINEKYIKGDLCELCDDCLNIWCDSVLTEELEDFVLNIKGA